MTYPVFTPPKAPDRQAKGSVKPRVLRAKFGDGYGQRTQDGLNTQEETWTVVWSLLTDTEKDGVLGFLEARGGAEAFDYQLPGDSATKRWIAPDWSHEHTAYGVHKVSAKFERVYDL